MAARGRGPDSLNDPQVLLGVVWDQWNNVFRDSLGPAERTLVSELRGVRNQWAHNEEFSTNDVIRGLDSMERLLNAVSPPKPSRCHRPRLQFACGLFTSSIGWLFSGASCAMV
jgi:hypothetical protein